MQYRAIGVVRGQYVPTDAEQPSRGVIRSDDGTEIEAVVLGRVLSLVRRHLDMATAHLWVVYPRLRETDNLHLQIVGVWEPSTLDSPAASAEPAEKAESSPSNGDELPEGDRLPEGDDYFSVRGELIYTRPESGEVVIKIRQKPRADGSRVQPFKLQLKGEIPLEHLRHFVSLDLRRQGSHLCTERYEVIAPVAQRGNRGGKDRSGKERNGRAGGSHGETPPRAGLRSAIIRPGN